MKKIIITISILVAVILIVFFAPKLKFSQLLLKVNSDHFKHIIIDDNIVGLRAVCDINGDGYNDIVVRGEPEAGYSNLVWYKYPDWQKSTIADSENFRSDDFRTADIDKDGDSDIIVVIDEPGNIFWYENQINNDRQTESWVSKHFIGKIENSGDSYVKDMGIADFTDDDLLDIAVRTHEKVFIFQQIHPLKWIEIQQITIHPHEGMDVGDLDSDGDIDIVLNGFWLENPQNPAEDKWQEHNINEKWWQQNTSNWQDNNCKVHIADINSDGILDVLLSHSEKPDYPIAWYELKNSKAEIWTEHIITPQFDFCHTLQAADFDNDGDMDVLAAEMPKSNNPDQITLFMNSENALSWEANVIGKTGNYSASIGDIDNDNDTDIIGCRNWNTPPLEIWQNNLNTKLDKWTYICIDDNRKTWGDFAKPQSVKYFGLAMSDLTHDGKADIVSGRYFYQNPGNQLNYKWRRTDLGYNIDAVLITNVDDDKNADIIAQALPEIFWLEAADSLIKKWNAVKIGTIPETEHRNAQGYNLAQIIPGGKPEILMGSGDGIFYLQIPEIPATGNWGLTHITRDASDEAIAVGDIDNDNFIDVAGIDKTDGNRIVWWKNPANNSSNWQKFNIGRTDGKYPDRVVIADINGDNKVDVIATEEGQPVESVYKTYWFKNPVKLGAHDWQRYTVATQYTTNSLDVADMDNDGDMDIITGEHRGTKKVIIWENILHGNYWRNLIVSTGLESHLGTRIVDIDKDGDLDIVSIGWDNYKKLHLWRNDAKHKAY